MSDTGTFWRLGYARSGKELEVMDQLADLGVEHWRGEKIKYERRGKHRTPEPYIYPAIPNYIFLRPSPSFSPAEVKFLAWSMMVLSESSMASVRRFWAEAEARLAEAQRIQGNRKAISEYSRGDRVEIVAGPLAGQFATFERMVRGQLYPKLRVEAELLGGAVPVDVDPLDVRRAG